MDPRAFRSPASGSDDGRDGRGEDDLEDDSYDRFEDDEEPEEEEGEDLMDTMEKDYQYIPELDQYEADGIDDRDHDDMDFGTRRLRSTDANARVRRALQRRGCGSSRSVVASGPWCPIRSSRGRRRGRSWPRACALCRRRSCPRTSTPSCSPGRASTPKSRRR